MRTPEDFLELLAAHGDSDDQLIERARSLTPLEVETSTDPEVLLMIISYYPNRLICLKLLWLSG
jgi:hypothetical protein